MCLRTSWKYMLESFPPCRWGDQQALRDAMTYPGSRPGLCTGDQTGAGPWIPCSVGLLQERMPHTTNRAEDKFKGGEGVNSGQEWGPRGV